MYKTGNYIIYKEHMNLRVKPRITSAILGIIPQGTYISVEEVWDNWGKVTFNGNSGWCCISECFAKPVCACTQNECCYFERYNELNTKYQKLLKQVEQNK